MRVLAYERALLMEGDCLEGLPMLPPHSVDLILCDLPYDTTDCAEDQPIPLDRLWPEYKRLLSPGGCIVLFGSMPFTAELVQSNRPWFRDHLVWNKNKCGSPGLARVRPMRVHEDVLVFAPGRTVYNPQMMTGTPYARQSKRPEGYVGKHNRHGYGLKPKKGFVNHGTRYPKSILNISRDFSAQQQLHPHQKPVPTMSWLVRTYSNPGAVILDNAMGVGSTGLAVLMDVERGHRFIGMEQVPQHFETSRFRLEGLMGGRVQDPLPNFG